MKKLLAVFITIVMIIQISIPISAATVVLNDKAPDYDIWMADALIDGLDGDGAGLYKTFISFQDPVYKVLGGELLNHVPLVSMSTAWSVFLNSEYRNQFANEQKYIYEIILMDYLKYGVSAKSTAQDLIGNEFKYAKKLYSGLSKELSNNTIDYIDKELSVEKAAKIFKNIKTIEKINEALNKTNDVKNVKTFIEEISQYLVLREVKDNKISLLKASKEAAGNNQDYKNAVDDIVRILESMDLGYIQNRSLKYLWDQMLNTAWGKLTKVNPILKGIEYGVDGLDMCFDTSQAASNNLKLALLYTIDCYMSMGRINAVQEYLSKKTVSNAVKVRECFEGYVHFQMFGNDFAKKWLGQYLSGGAIKDLFNHIFNQENIKNAKELEKLAQSQINTRETLLNLIEKYTNIYKNKYPIAKKQTATTVGTVQITKVDSSKQNKLSIYWNRVSGANGYQVYISDSQNGEYKKVATTGAKETSYILKVTNGKTVYIKIRAFKNTGYTKKYGDFSQVKKGTEIGAVWYKKVLKTKSKDYIVRYQYGRSVKRKKVNIKDYPYYTVVDLDRDGIKELILHTDFRSSWDENSILLMTYYNNEVKPLLHFGGCGARGHFYLTGKNIAMVSSGSDGAYSVYFTVKKGKLVKVHDMEYLRDKSSIPYRSYYYVNGRSVSEATYNQTVRRYFPSTLKDMKFQKIES